MRMARPDAARSGPTGKLRRDNFTFADELQVRNYFFEFFRFRTLRLLLSVIKFAPSRTARGALKRPRKFYPPLGFSKPDVL